MGFSDKFIHFIKILYKSNISYIINYEFLSSPVQLLRGLRQGMSTIHATRCNTQRNNNNKHK